MGRKWGPSDGNTKMGEVPKRWGEGWDGVGRGGVGWEWSGVG